MDLKEIAGLVKGKSCTDKKTNKPKFEVVNKKSSIVYNLEDGTNIEVDVTEDLPEEGPDKLTIVLNQIYRITANLKCWASGSEKVTTFISKEYMSYLLPRIAYLIDCIADDSYGNLNVDSLPKEIKNALVSRGLLFFINQYKTDSLIFLKLYQEEFYSLVDNNKELIEKLMTIIY